MGTSLLHTGDIAEGRAHLDQAIALYDPAEHRPLATRFGEDRVQICAFDHMALWLLGYPEAALADTDQALKDAREIGHASLSVMVHSAACFLDIFCGSYMTANAEADELIALADEKDAAYWKAFGMLDRGWLLGLTGKASDAVQMITSGRIIWRSTGSTVFDPMYLSYLANAYAELRRIR